MSETPKIAAIVLAAGQGSRMGGPTKQLSTIGGRPLVRIVAEAALASRAEPVLVVTGHRAAEVGAALAGLDLRLVANPHFAEGLASSLRAGILALPEDAAAAIVLLADMPAITAAMIDRFVDAFAAGAAIAVATHEGARGNPVLWSRRHFAELAALSGDVGGRAILAAHQHEVVTVEIGPAARLDLDTPEALAAAGGRLAGAP